MNKQISYCSLIVFAAFLSTAIVCKPEILSDANGFLKELVGVNLLLVAGVILTITLASAGQIHLSLNEIEARVGYTFLHKTRAGLHSSAYWMIALFFFCSADVILKPYFVSVQWKAFFNGLSLFLLFWMVLIMTSLTRLVFAIKPHHPNPDPEATDPLSERHDAASKLSRPRERR